MIQTSFSDHNGIKVGIKNKKIFVECLKHVKVKNHSFKKPRDKNEITWEIRYVFKLKEKKKTTY